MGKHTTGRNGSGVAVQPRRLVSRQQKESQAFRCQLDPAMGSSRKLTSMAFSRKLLQLASTRLSQHQVWYCSLALLDGSSLWVAQGFILAEFMSIYWYNVHQKRWISRERFKAKYVIFIWTGKHLFKGEYISVLSWKYPKVLCSQGGNFSVKESAWLS